MYYVMIKKIRHSEWEKVIRGFQCPTVPRIFVYIERKKEDGGFVVKSIVERCKIKRRYGTINLELVFLLSVIVRRED